MKTTQQKESLDALSKKGTCIEFFSAYQDFDLERMLSLCDPEGIVFFEPLGETFKGSIHALGKNVWAGLMEAFPNLDNTVKNQVYDEHQNTVTCLVTIFGKQEKEFAGIPNKGKDLDSDHIFIFRFNENCKITDINVQWDHNRFVAQLSI